MSVIETGIGFPIPYLGATNLGGTNFIAVGIGPGQPTFITVAAGATASFILAANEGYKYTYTAAPTHLWQGL